MRSVGPGPASPARGDGRGEHAAGSVPPNSPSSDCATMAWKPRSWLSASTAARSTSSRCRQWADPPKARIAELVAAVEDRLHASGIASIADVVTIAEGAARDAGLPNARISSDAKYVEIGLTDKADAARWTFADLWEHGISAADVLVAGDEFGDARRRPRQRLADPCPRGTGRGGGDRGDGTIRCSTRGAATARRARTGPSSCSRISSDGGGWESLPSRGRLRLAVAIDGLDGDRERSRASVLTIADGYIGSSAYRCCRTLRHRRRRWSRDSTRGRVQASTARAPRLEPARGVLG